MGMVAMATKNWLLWKQEIVFIVCVKYHNLTSNTKKNIKVLTRHW